MSVLNIPFLVRVNFLDLNIRIGPGIDYSRIGRCTGIGAFTIVELKDSKCSSEGRGISKK